MSTSKPQLEQVELSPLAHQPRPASDAEVEAVVAAVLKAHANNDVLVKAVVDERSTDDHPPDVRPDVANLLGIAAGECARRGIEDAYAREMVFNELKRVATRKAKDKTFEELANMLKDPGRRATVKGFVFEAADKSALDALAKVTGGRTRTLVLNGAHNTKAIDGHYVEAARRTRGATMAGQAAKKAHASHKCSANANVHRTAATKLKHDLTLLKQAEAVVPRGAGKTARKALEGHMPVRESAHSVKQIEKLTKKAADPKMAKQVGRAGAKKAASTALRNAGLASAGMSVACDAKGLTTGEKSLREVAENAGWAAAEGMATTAVVVGTTTAATPVVLGATVALTASSVAGTTAMAGVLAATGPVGLTIGTGLAVGWGFKKVRKAVCG